MSDVPMNSVSYIPFHPDTGFSGVSEEGRNAYIRARLAQQVADKEWLNKPFVPKDLDKFRSTK